MSPATLMIASQVSAKFGHVEDHFPTFVAMNWDPFKGAGMAERETHKYHALRQYCVAECSTGSHSYYGRGEPL